MSDISAQLRWNCVRLTEQLQLCELEKISLIKELESLKKQPKLPSPPSDSNVNSKKLNSVIFSFIKTIRKDLQSMKGEMDLICNDRNVKFDEFSRTISQLERALACKNIEIKGLRSANEELNLKLKTGEEDSFSLIQSKIQEIERLKSKLSTSRQELGDCDHARSTLSAENDSLRRKYEDIYGSFSQLQSKLDISQNECKKLKQQLASLDSQHQQNYQDASQQQQQMALLYEQIIAGLKIENEELKNMTLAMEDQIQKLSAALLGNKSHFAKFVELKSENIKLQNKLSEITKKSNVGLGLLSGPSMSGNSNLNTTSILAAPSTTSMYEGLESTSVKKKVLSRRKAQENSFSTIANAGANAGANASASVSASAAMETIGASSSTFTTTASTLEGIEAPSSLSTARMMLMMNKGSIDSSISQSFLEKSILLNPSTNQNQDIYIPNLSTSTMTTTGMKVDGINSSNSSSSNSNSNSNSSGSFVSPLRQGKPASKDAMPILSSIVEPDICDQLIQTEQLLKQLQGFSKHLRSEDGLSNGINQTCTSSMSSTGYTNSNSRSHSSNGHSSNTTTTTASSSHKDKGIPLAISRETLLMESPPLTARCLSTRSQDTQGPLLPPPKTVPTPMPMKSKNLSQSSQSKIII